MTSSEIRPARLAECPEIAALLAATLQESWTAPQLASEIAMPEGRVWVARSSSGALSGFLVARRELDELHLLLIGVDPAARRSGVGQRLLEACLAAERGLARIHLEVREGNAPARAFYQRLGFSQDGNRPRHYPGGEAAVLMSRKLVPRG